MSAVRPVLCLLTALSLSACNATSLTEVRGEVHGWTFGAGTVEFLSDDLKTLSSADLDRVGRFTLKLPPAESVTPLLEDSLIPELPAGCTNTVKASGPAKYYSLGDITAYPSSGQKDAYTLVSQDRGGTDPVRVTKRLFIFASQDVQVRGTLSCPVNGGTAVATYGLDLKTGWNRVASNQSISAGGGSQTSIAATGDDGFERWSVTPGQ